MWSYKSAVSISCSNQQISFLSYDDSFKKNRYRFMANKNLSLQSVLRQLSYIHPSMDMVTSCGPTNQLFLSAVQISKSANQLFISAFQISCSNQLFLIRCSNQIFKSVVYNQLFKPAVSISCSNQLFISAVQISCFCQMFKSRASAWRGWWTPGSPTGRPRPCPPSLQPRIIFGS